MTTKEDRLVEEYLDRLQGELADIPRARRRELVGEIADHIAEGRGQARTEAEVRTLLDRLGEPAEIADEARERFGVVPTVAPRRSRALEICALVALAAGAVFLPVIGPVLGLVLVGVSQVWTTAEKIIAAIIVVGGYLLTASFIAAGGALSIGPSDLLGLGLALVLAPLLATVYLGMRLRSL